MQYRGTLYIGEPPKAFSLIFDTGSSWLWVTNSTCGKSCHKVNSAYDHRASVTYRSRGFRVTLEYGMGTAMGTVGNETVSLSPQAAVANQTFVTVYRNSGFGGMKADGILVRTMQGLGFSVLADHNLTLVDNLYRQGFIEAPLFSIYLSDNAFGKRPRENFTSEITFGFWDLKKYARGDTLVYLPVYSNTGYWAVPLKAVHLGNETIAGSSFIGIIDSGTSLLIGPASEVQDIFSYFIQRMQCFAHGSLLDCVCGDSLEELPDLTFVLGNDGMAFTITPDLYTIHRNGSCLLLFDSFQDSGLWILGDVFLRSYYTVFDMQNSRVGIAPSINNVRDVSIYQPASDTLGVIASVVLLCVFLCISIVAWRYSHALLHCCKPEEVPLQQRLLVVSSQ